MPVIIGNTFRLGRVEARLFDHDINASPIFPPGVPINGGRLRFFITSEHTSEEIGATIGAVLEALAACRRFA